jgi:bacterioferritin (cytochrome b1)
MAVATELHRTWIISELVSLVEAERSMAEGTQARAESPPDVTLGVVYHEISAADLQHAVAIETIATRYGHTPVRGKEGGIGEAIGRFKKKVSEMGSDPLECITADLAAKAEAIQRYIAWVHAFEAIGDIPSGREIAGVLAEEQAHHDFLQSGSNRLVEQAARGEKPALNQPPA